MLVNTSVVQYSFKKCSWVFSDLTLNFTSPFLLIICFATSLVDATYRAFIYQVNDLRKELESRTLSSKGLKSQLIARLTKQLKVEEQKEEQKELEKSEKEEEEEEDRKSEDDKEVRFWTCLI